MKSPAWTILAGTTILAAAVASVAAAPAGAAAPPSSPLPDGPGKAIAQRMCVGCHTLTVVTSKRATPAEWTKVVQLMVIRGAEGTDQEIDTLTRYLAANFGPSAPPSTPRPEAPAPADDTPAAAPSPVPTSTASPSQPAITPPASDAASAPVDHPRSAVHVNVNSASARELESALSLTRQEAETLAQYREHTGKFQNWQEVGEIPGVPAGKIEKYQDRLSF